VTVSTPGSGLVFDNTYTANCTAQYEACIVAAEKQLESLISTSDTIVVTFNEANQGNSGVALGNSSNGWNVSYANLRAALLKVAPGDVLPTTDPSGGANWYVPASYARMLGLNSATDSPDLSVTLNTYYSWDYGQDVINGLTHELSEGGLGRIGGLGGTSGSGGGWSTMDLFRYNAQGQADYSDGRDGKATYFSANGGSTLSNENLPGKGAPTLSYNNQYNSNGTLNNTGDTADWVQEAVFGTTGGGETLALTQTELDVLQALGWKITLRQDVDETSGAWQTPANWSTGSMPIEPQDVYISGSSVVTLDSNVIVNSIATQAGSILEIGDSTATTLTAVDGTNLNSEDVSSTATGNLGEILVYTGSTLQIGYFTETFDNAGTVTLGKGAGGSGSGDLDLAGSVNLTGGGTLTLGESGTTGDILNAPTTTGSLVNVNNTITGSGLIELNGSFDNQAAGVIEAQSDLQISAGTFTNEGAITVEASARLDFGQDGATQSIDNTGSVLVLANADLQISGTYTASGSGDIYLKGAGAEITSDGTAATFINASTIEADNTSQIGDPNLTFSNSGTVAASLSGNILSIATGANSILNTGTLAAGNGATLAIDSNLNNQGTLTAGGVSSGETSTGAVDLGLDHGTGSATNTGAILVYGDSDLAIRGNYTVSGSGDIGFKGAGAAITSDGLAAATFTNASTIDALYTGQIGDVGIESASDLTFVNKGSVYASGSGVALTINTGSLTIYDAGGLLEAENGATLTIDSNVYTGTGGTIEAGSGGSVLISGTLSGAVTLDAASGSVLTSTGGGSFAGTITGAGEVVIAGATTLDAGASLSVANLLETANLTLSGVSLTNAASHTFSITPASGATVTLRSAGTGSFTNDGNLRIDGSGTALIVGPLIDQGAISVTSGTLQVSGALSGNGSLAIGAGAEALLTAGGSLTETISGAGTLILGGAYKLNKADVTAGTVQINSTGTLSGTGTLAGAVVDNGTVAASGGTLKIDGAVSGSGTLSASAGAVLDLSGGGSFDGAISGAGTVTVAHTTTLQAGATLSASDVIVTSELELAGVAVTNTAGHTFALTAASAASTAKLYGETGGTFTNAGSLIANGAGTASVSGSFTNSGTVSALSGTLSFLSKVGGTGALDVGTGGTLSLGLGASSGQTVDFLGTNGVLDLSNPLDFVGKIAGFGSSDEIFLKNAAYTTFSFSNNLLTVKDGSTTIASLHIAESSNHFSLHNESGGVLITFG